MRSMTASPLVIATFCLSLLDTNAQENPPILKTPKPAAVPTNKPAPGKQTPKTPTPLRTGGGNQYFIEKLQKLNGDLEQLMGAYNLQIRKMEALEAQVKNLQTANENLKRENVLRFASNKDIEELASKLVKLDNNLRNDLKLTNQQIDVILKTIQKIANSPAPASPPTRNNPAPANFQAREHVVQSGEFLSTILSAYNTAFKEEGLKGRVSQSQVLKANPGIKADRLLVGQKLLIPLPGEIK